MNYAVVLATYNGARHVQALLESIARQSIRPQKIIARDDGSTDATRELATAAAQALGLPLEWLPGERQLGACASFSETLRHALDHPYIFLADQDDLWVPEKARVMLEALRDAEARFGEECPMLIHSDLVVVDENAAMMAPSFFRYQGFSFPQHSFASLLLQNTATGCACALNRSLARLALPIDPAAVMHDWWLALVAQAFGRKIVLPAALVLYRQHGGNTIGAKRWGLSHIVRRAVAVLTVRGARDVVGPLARQSLAFSHRYGASLSVSLRQQLDAVSLLGSRRLSRRLLGVWRLRDAKQGLVRTAGLAVAAWRSDGAFPP